MRRAARALAVALVLTGSLAAQDRLAGALAFERKGDFVGAAAAWRTLLAETPGDLAVLLGLERALTPMGRLAELAGPMQTAAQRGASAGLYGIAVRVWTAAQKPDSARAAVERWSALEPGSEMPFQEWGLAAYAARDRASARSAYQLGRQKLGRPDAMAAELAQIAVAEGDYSAAAKEWARAIKNQPGYRGTALSMLAQVPPAGHSAVLRELSAGGEMNSERLAASLLARWSDPAAAVRLMAGAVAAGGPESVEALQELLEELRGSASNAQVVARATVLSMIADRTEGAQRARIRLDAAQAYADAGDQGAARRMLAVLAGDPAATPAMAATATSTLVSVLVDEGGIEEADRRFRELAPLLGAEDRERLGLRLAQGWIRTGRFARADSLLQSDSSVDAEAVRGRIALYQGDLVSARARLAEAGPFTGDRAAATERIAVLGLLQILEGDSLAALGKAFYQLEQHDSAAAAAGLEQLAPTLPPDHGGAELLLLAGRLRAGLGQKPEAEKILRGVVQLAVPASSAAAEFVLADLLLKSARKDQAIASLEHLLVTWPTSAVVPEARRLLDVARGAVPSA